MGSPLLDLIDELRTQADAFRECTPEPSPPLAHLLERAADALDDLAGQLLDTELRAEAAERKLEVAGA